MRGTHDQFVECFRIFDYENNGLVTAAEMRHIMTSLGEALSEREMEAVLEGGVDVKGMVNYEELIRKVMDG